MAQQKSGSLIPNEKGKVAAVEGKIKRLLKSLGYRGPSSLLFRISYPTQNCTPLVFHHHCNFTRGFEPEIMEHYWAMMSKLLRSKSADLAGHVIGKNMLFVSARRICFANKAPARMQVVMWLPNASHDLQKAVAAEISTSLGEFIQIIFPGL